MSIKLIDILINKNLISEDEKKNILEKKYTSENGIFEEIIKNEKIEEDTLLSELAEPLNIPFSHIDRTSHPSHTSHKTSHNISHPSKTFNP